MAKAAKKATNSSPKRPVAKVAAKGSAKPAAKKQVKAPSKVTAPSKVGPKTPAKSAAKAPATPATKTASKPTTPPKAATPKKGATAPAKVAPPAKPAPAPKAPPAGKPAAPAKAPAASQAVSKNPADKNAKPTATDAPKGSAPKTEEVKVPTSAPAAKSGKKSKGPAVPEKVVIAAKPGQILLTPLKPTGATPKPPVAAAPVAAPAATPAPTPAPEAVKKPKPILNPPPLPPAPVTTDSKAKKNQAGLLAKELDFYRDLLLAKRRELLGDMVSMEREALRGAGSNLSNLPVHMADMGTDNYEQEFTLGLVEKDRALLLEINRALAKIQNGTYGICEGTGKPISKARLEAQPWSKYSIEYVRQMEQRTFRR